MKKYKLKKDFLYLKTGDTVEITRVKDLLAGLPRYIILENIVKNCEEDLKIIFNF